MDVDTTWIEPSSLSPNSTCFWLIPESYQGYSNLAYNLWWVPGEEEERVYGDRDDEDCAGYEKESSNLHLLAALHLTAVLHIRPPPALEL